MKMMPRGPFEKSLRSPRGVLWRRPTALFLYPALRAVSPYTMVWHEALMQMHDLIKKVDAKGVEGAIVETGCWRGGCGAFMSWSSKKNGSNRITWLFDSFEGLPAPTQKDTEFFAHMRVPDVVAFKEALSSPMEKAKEIATMMGVADRTRIVKGWFKDTVPSNKKEIGKIAVLRLDGDLYDSTKVVLDELYDQLADNGYVVIDDYAFEGVRRALYDFFHERGIAPFLEEHVATEGHKYERTYFRVVK